MDIQKEEDDFNAWFNKQTINAVPDADLSLQRLWASLAWQAQAAKAQAVPEGFVLVEKAKLMQIIGSVSMIEPITRGNPYMDSVKRELTSITDVVKTVIKAQESTND